MFYSPDENFIEKYKEELRNHNGAVFHNRVLKHEDKHWIFIQSTPENIIREHYANFMGDGIVNIAKTKILTKDEVIYIINSGIVSNLDMNNLNGFIVRAAQEYETKELPLASLDAATAGELVFSTIIRRRDAHEFNRSYNPDEIPVFFDNGVAFAADANMLNGEAFFSHHGSGFAGYWKVYTLENKIKDMGRTLGPTDRHFVHNIEKFRQQIEPIAVRLKQRADDIEAFMVNGNFSGVEVNRIVSVIQQTRNTIENDLQLMLTKVLS